MATPRSGHPARDSFLRGTALASSLLLVGLMALPASAAPARQPVRACDTEASVQAGQEGETVWQKWQRGLASWYGAGFNDRRTASGESFDMNELTAAHRTLPFGTQVKVRNPNNNRTVVVRINDRGPFSGGRSIDLSKAAASALGILNRGTAQVELLIESSMSTAVAKTGRDPGKGCGQAAD